MDNEFESLIKSSDDINNTKITEISSITDVLIEDIKTYNNIISSFFVGKENEIKQIYNSIKNKKFPFNKVSVLDINFVSNTYLEYFEGMIEFINKVVDLNDSDEVSNESISSTINKINERDSEFIESIFGGSRCSESSVDINTAMLNVEKLIDINEDFSMFINTVNKVCEYAQNNNSSKYKNEIILALNVLLKSIRVYNRNCVSNILKTYDKITASIQVRTPASGVLHKVQKYQMF